MLLRFRVTNFASIKDEQELSMVGGFLLPGESAPPADRLRRATWVLSRQDGAWAVAAYANCPATT